MPPVKAFNSHPKKERYFIPKRLGKISRSNVTYPDWVNKSIPEPVILVKEIYITDG